MTREQKIATARKLRAKGATYKAIGEQVGVSASTVVRWLNPGAAERSRTASLAWKRRNRKRHNAHCRRWYYDSKVPCPRCGQPMTQGARLCRACRSDDADRKARQVEQWWAEGLTISEIAERLGTTVSTVRVSMNHWRRLGYDLPYRRRRKAEAA